MGKVHYIPAVQRKTVGRKEAKFIVMQTVVENLNVSSNQISNVIDTTHASSVGRVQKDYKCRR